MTFAPKERRQKANKKPNSIVSESQAAAKPKERLASLSRPVHKTSYYFYQIYRKAWGWSLATLPFDLCLVLFLPLAQPAIIPEAPILIIQLVSACLLLIASTWFVREWIIKLLSDWENVANRILGFIERNPVLLLAFLGIFIAVEVILKVGQIGIWSGVLALVVVLGSLKTLRENWRERLKLKKAVAGDLALQIESFNLKLFLVHAIPLLSTRLTILIGALAFPLGLKFDPTFLVSISVGCIFLSLMQAEERYFMIQCRRCGTQTSRFLEKYSVCLLCLPKENIPEMLKPR